MPCRGIQGRIGTPTGAAGTDAVVHSVMMAHGTALSGLFCQLCKTVAGKAGIILIQLREIEGMIPVTAMDHISLAGNRVLIDIDIPAVPAGNSYSGNSVPDPYSHIL